MEYILLSNHMDIRARFERRFTLTYPDFCRVHRERMRQWKQDYRRMFTQAYFERTLYSDRLIPGFREVSFADALSQLRSWDCPARFLTNGPECLSRDFAILGNQALYCAQADARAIADRLEFEWFEGFRLNEQMMYLADAIFPSEVYVFDEAMGRCLIFTHETDGTELPESRICLAWELKTS